MKVFSTDRGLLVPNLLIGASLLLVSQVAAAAPEDHNPALIRVLRAVDIVPTPAQLAAITGDTPEQELYAVALDATLAEYVNTRATSLLSMFPNRRSAAYLESIASTVTHRATRWMAVYTRIRAFGDEDSVRFAETTLATPMTRIRHAVVRALRWVALSSATELLTLQHDREPDARLRRTIQRMLTLRRTSPRKD